MDDFDWFFITIILIAVVLVSFAIGILIEEKNSCEDFGGKYIETKSECYKNGEIFEIVSVNGNYKVGRIAVSEDIK